MLVGVALPADRAAQVEMAASFAEEFARMGHGERQILSIFKQPFYAGAHGVYVQLGEEEVRAIIREVLGAWGRVRLVDRDAPRAAAGDAEECDHE